MKMRTVIQSNNTIIIEQEQSANVWIVSPDSKTFSLEDHDKAYQYAVMLQQKLTQPETSSNGGWVAGYVW